MLGLQSCWSVYNLLMSICKSQPRLQAQDQQQKPTSYLPNVHGILKIASKCTSMSANKKITQDSPLLGSKVISSLRILLLQRLLFDGRLHLPSTIIMKAYQGDKDKFSWRSNFWHVYIFLIICVFCSPPPALWGTPGLPPMNWDPAVPAPGENNIDTVTFGPSFITQSIIFN